MAVNTNPVSCDRCGQKWTRHFCLEVPCPRCHAPIGSPCKRPSEHTAADWHREREQLAVDRGIVGICPEGPTSRAQRATNPA